MSLAPGDAGGRVARVKRWPEDGARVRSWPETGCLGWRVEAHGAGSGHGASPESRSEAGVENGLGGETN